MLDSKYQGRGDLPHFLDKEAAKFGCLISDLRLHPILRRAALWDLLCANCPQEQRTDSLKYLMSGEPTHSNKEVNDYG